MLKRLLFFTSMFVVFAVASAQGQQFSIKTDYGFLFVQNDPVRSFTFEIRGKEVKPQTTGENPAFMVDGVLVQVVFADTQEFGTPVKGLSDERVLDLHRKWESDYLSGPFEAQLKVNSEFKTIAGQTVNIWSFTRPKFAEEYDRDCFITTVVGTHVLGLNSPIVKNDKLDRYVTLLSAVMATLVLSDKPFDVDALAASFKVKKQIG